MQPEVCNSVTECLHKRRVKGDNQSACWKSRYNYWGGLSELCSPNARCTECIDINKIVFDFLTKQTLKSSLGELNSAEIKAKTTHCSLIKTRMTYALALANYRLTHLAVSYSHLIALTTIPILKVLTYYDCDCRTTKTSQS